MPVHPPASERNREPILSVLRALLAPDARVLEVASGTGAHALHCAAALPLVTWQPTERDDEALAALRANLDASPLPNLREPLALDASAPERWPALAAPPDAVVCVNMVHIAPWSATEGLFAGAAARLAPEGLLYLYGPFREDGLHNSEGNASFDAQLRARDERWGLRDLRDLEREGARRGLRLERVVPMPANNRSLVFRRGASGERA